MAFEFVVAHQGNVLVNPHRGDCLFYPENTMLAFQSALEKGTSCIEIDVAMTSDGHIVVIHDPSVDRTSNGSGYVEQMTLAQLKALDFGQWFDDKFQGTSISLLSDVLDWALLNQVGLVIEAKQRRLHQEFALSLVELLKQKPKSIDQVLLLGFDHSLINRAKALLPELKIQVVTLAKYDDQVGAVLASNADSVCVEYPYTSKEVLEGYKAAGLSVRLYLPNKGENIVTTQWFNQYYGYDVHSEVIDWIRSGLIDMLSHDDIDMLKDLIEEAGMKAI
ncbi:glycerophosphodiester phosphodiesterase [Vibrio sp. RE86]|uniref:glycerophosphodiester phosphodiesterase n=1 Tax=Vibrio sp. RE86 TaxID=2607605 RepID=UPI001493AEAF|nr:glycerophosphodiester phosphodiesterase family protein [Vibrio sp. RE86]NOH78205.1 glycerophosphodiester phosphodiesterase [Vibrio sp. RE86]